jgi:hypothetical protein
MRLAVVQPGGRARACADKAAIVVHDAHERPDCDAEAAEAPERLQAGGEAPRRPALERSGRVRASELRAMVDDFIAWESEQLHEGKAPRRADKPGGAGAGDSPLGQLLPSAVRKCRSLARISLHR